jgi:ATP-dependent Clp endopeptidase proteolytic subunit ClpP
MQGDPFGLLLRQRVVFLGGEVEDFGADAIISQLLLLDNQDPQKDIKMFINSPGGQRRASWRRGRSGSLRRSLSSAVQPGSGALG